MWRRITRLWPSASGTATGESTIPDSIEPFPTKRSEPGAMAPATNQPDVSSPRADNSQSPRTTSRPKGFEPLENIGRCRSRTSSKKASNHLYCAETSPVTSHAATTNQGLAHHEAKASHTSSRPGSAGTSSRSSKPSTNPACPANRILRESYENVQRYAIPTPQESPYANQVGLAL